MARLLHRLSAPDGADGGNPPALAGPPRHCAPERTTFWAEADLGTLSESSGSVARDTQTCAAWRLDDRRSLSCERT
jgi:hypothetical protein